MLTKEQILDTARVKGKIISRDFSDKFSVSRQYVNLLVGELVRSKRLIKIGSTRNAFYVLPQYVHEHPDILPNRFLKRFKMSGLEEHAVSMEIEERFPQIAGLKEHIKSIFDFAFSEMLNNAIEHSNSRSVIVEVSITGDELWFIISDSGIGVFRNVMRKNKLKSELEAAQDILKGKTTTIPKSHTGQGIFFTSKAADTFVLESFEQMMLVNNKAHNISIRKTIRSKRGTRVVFRISLNSDKHLSDVFKKYTNLKDESDYGFDKTEIRVKLYIESGINISRSQARRILHGLDKFKVILFDFDKVPMIGQAFADEIFRVFKNRHPEIELQEVNMTEAVEFMVKRAKTDAKQS